MESQPTHKYAAELLNKLEEVHTTLRKVQIKIKQEDKENEEEPLF